MSEKETVKQPAQVHRSDEASSSDWARRLKLGLRKYVPTGLWVRLRDFYRFRLQGRWFDWRHRVETYGMMPTTDALTGLPGVEYYPTPLKDLRLMLRLAERYQPDLQRYTFIDIGCGKGRAILLASAFPYRRIVGVEMSSELLAVAQRNLNRFRGTSQKCARIETVLCEASRYNFPSEPAVLFMFNPFGAEVMRRVVENLQSSLDHHPRPVMILYHYPVQRALIESLRNIRLLEQSTVFSYCVYAID